MTQKSTLQMAILALLLVSLGLMASEATFAGPNFVTRAQFNARLAKERAARIAADNNLSSSIRSTQHFVGEAYGGGLIFYVYDDGQHGLIAAASDLTSGITWSNGTSRVTATAGDGVNAGAMNTAMIVATQINDNPSSNFAAKLCADFSVTDVDGVTYGDWYLPSKTELNLLFLQKVASTVRGLTNNFYWSSTETGLGTAWGQNLGNGNAGIIVKGSNLAIRPIRSF
jgi:hypothetical protein